MGVHFVDFEILREKGDFLKITISHLGLNGGVLFTSTLILDPSQLFPNDQKMEYTAFSYYTPMYIL